MSFFPTAVPLEIVVVLAVRQHTCLMAGLVFRLRIAAQFPSPAGRKLRLEPVPQFLVALVLVRSDTS